jgi:hypothetical protein
MSGQRRPPQYDILLPVEAISFDTSAFDQMLRSQGVVFEHYRAIKCPIGLDDRFDVHSHAGHDNCSNGFIYKFAGNITGFFSGNSSNSTLDDLGLIDGSTCQVTLPRYYDDKENEDEVAVQHYDRFYLKDVAGTSVNTQTVEAHVTGIDRLQYPAVKVEYVIDAHGIEYTNDDFRIVEGRIHWGQRRPHFDPKLNKGTTYAIRYRYTPFWYVKNLLHEVRLTRKIDFQLNKQVVVRMPHAVQLQREFVFENEERTRNGPSDARDVKSPRSGSFGPR